jgi:tRNA(Ile)-lysidine synthase
VVCAVSGGKDSMVLLDLLTLLAPELGITVAAAHFHHGLRGEEADRDAQFVADYCKAHRIPFRCGHGQTARRAKETGESIEQAARALRYDFLLAEAADGKLATAHTADDHAETVLINLLRGTGLRGLCGIPPRRENVVRPILCLDRRQVAQWLEERGLPHVEDSTNQSRAHLRNRVRQDVLPALTAEAPDWAAAMVEQGQLLRQDADFLDDLGRQLLDRAQTDGGLCLPVLRDAPAPVRSRAVLFWLRQMGVRDPGLRHVDAVLDLVAATDGSAQLDLPGGVTVLRTYDTLTTWQAVPSLSPQTVPVPGEIFWGSWHIRTQTLPCWDGRPTKNGWTVSLPAGPLTVRSRRTGDIICLPGGTRTLKKRMIDQKIPASLRDTLPVLCDNQTVVCAAEVGVSTACAAVVGAPALQIFITKERE